MSFKGRFQAFIFLIRFRWAYLLVILITLVSIVYSILTWPYQIWAIIVSAFLIVAGLFILWNERRKIISDRRDLYYEAPFDVKAFFDSARLSPKYMTYTKESFNSFIVIYSREVNKILWGSPIFFRMKLYPFNLPSQANRLAPMVIASELSSGKEVFNEPKIRLCSDLTQEILNSGQPLLLQKTNYFNGLVTNQLTGDKISSRSDKTVIYNGLEFVINKEIIYDLSDSPCSNHIGISTLAFIKDGRFIINTQTRESRQSPQLLAPSGSGSVDLIDWQNNPKSFITIGMERELVEECTKIPVNLNNLNDICRTRIIGFARMLHQGGKPEFFGITRFEVNETDLKLRRGEFRFIANIESIKVQFMNSQEVVEEIRKFRKKYASQLSCPLYLNLIFLEDFIERDPEAFVRFAFEAIN